MVMRCLGDCDGHAILGDCDGHAILGDCDGNAMLEIVMVMRCLDRRYFGLFVIASTRSERLNVRCFIFTASSATVGGICVV